MAKKSEVSGPYKLWTIVIRRPKERDAVTPQARTLADPKKPTVQAPEMEIWGKINILLQHADNTLLGEAEAKQILHQIVVESRPDLPRDCSYEFVQETEFWTAYGVPKITDHCPDHPDQKNSFCRKCGRKFALGLKATA